MGRMVHDLDVILPENDAVAFTANGKRYEINLRVPNAVSLIILDNAEVISALIPVNGGAPKITQETIDLMKRIFIIMARNQYPEIDEEFIDKNISLPRMLVIFIHTLKPIFEYMQNSGLTEMVKP